MDTTTITNTVIELTKNYPWFGIITATVTLASAIVAVTPTPAPTSKWAIVYKVIETVALVVGKAKDTGTTK